MYSKTAALASVRVRNWASWTRSVLSEAKKLSMGALSKQLPRRLIDSWIPCRSSTAAQDQVLVFEPLDLALEPLGLGLLDFAGGERLSRASRKLLIAPLAQLARAHIQLRSDVGERPTALNHTLNRLGLILAGEPPPGSFLCHSILLGCSGSLQNPPLHRGKPRLRLLRRVDRSRAEPAARGLLRSPRG